MVFQDYNGSLVPGDTDGIVDIFRVELKPHTLSIGPVAGDGIVSVAEAAAPVAINGTSDLVGAAVRILIDGAQFGSATVAADGSWSTSFNPFALTQGKHSILATLSDECGRDRCGRQHRHHRGDPSGRAHLR